MAVVIATASVVSDAMAGQLMGIWVRMATVMARRYAVYGPYRLCVACDNGRMKRAANP